MKEISIKHPEEIVIQELTLINLLLQNPQGLTINEIRTLMDYNDDVDEESVDRKIRRHREQIRDNLGIDICCHNRSRVYYIDKEVSFAENDACDIPDEYKRVIANLTIPQLLEESVDKADLIMALNKLGVPLHASKRYMDDEINEINFLKSAQGVEYAIWGAYSNRKRCSLTYITAEGNERKYSAEIYGTFSVGNHQYFTANISKDSQDIRTLRYDRVKKINVSSKKYEIPEDYRDQDYLKLPFQIGPTLYTSKVYIPKECVDEFISQNRNKGTLEALEDGDYYWYVEVSDQDIFLFWLISLRLIPIEPIAVKNAFVERLERTVHNG